VKLSGVILALSLVSAAWAAAADEAPKVAGSEVPVPKRVKFVAPDYPAEAQARGLRGIVILDVLIDMKGAVQSVEVTRSVPPFDDAAVNAVKQWEYEPTKLGGKIVAVRLTVPITFALKLPEMKRESGIPELRQGVSPGSPDSAAPGSRVVSADLTIASDGQVVEAQIVEGDSPWSDALLLAVRTWRFAPTADSSALKFKLKAEFQPGSGTDKAPKVALELSAPQRIAEAAAVPGPAAAAAAPPASGPTLPEPSAAPSSASPTAAPSAAPAVAEAPPPAPPAPVSPQAAAPKVAATGAAPRALPAAPPPIEVISAPQPPLAPEGIGVSAIRDVKVEAGIPDLIRGRRPMVPPFARIAGTEGTVEVKFGVDAAGGASNAEAVGPEPLKTAALQAVQSWAFRRTRADRLYLLANFTYAGDKALASVTTASATTP
jgi:TonB family protein